MCHRPRAAVLGVADHSGQAGALTGMHPGGLALAPGWACVPAQAAGTPGRPGNEDPLATLTPREAEVLRRIAGGQSTRTMAAEMKVTTETLRTYVRNVLAKLGAHSRLEAAAMASQPIPAAPRELDRDHPLLAGLTPREREILLHLTTGCGQLEVARRLHMSVKTVSTHLHNLRGKLGVHTTLEAVALARSRLGQRAAAADPGPAGSALSAHPFLAPPATISGLPSLPSTALFAAYITAQ
jgi:DNA-binding CsgD family transcriptional regulator